MNIFMNTFLRGEFDMFKILRILLCLVSVLFLISCTNPKREIISVNSEELLQDADNPGYFRKKYKNNEIYITGDVLYIGVPKDNPSKRDTTYVSIAEDDKTVVLIYFDLFINNYVEVGQRVKVKCNFRSFKRPTFYYNGNFVTFTKGEIVKIFDEELP